MNFIKIMMIFALALSVAACGKMSKSEPIEGSGYPHKYPREI